MSRVSFPEALRLVALKHKNDTQLIPGSNSARTTKHMTVNTFYHYIEEAFKVMEDGRSDLMPNSPEPKDVNTWHPIKPKTRKKIDNPDQLELFPDFKDVDNLPF